MRRFFNIESWRVLLVLIFIGMIVFVLAEPAWDVGAASVTYYFVEDSISEHNFTANLSDTSDLSHFLILDVSWVDGLLGPDHSDFYWMPWEDASFSNSSSGVINITPMYDNETGNFTLNVFAQGSATGTSVKFSFIINATNDVPNFTLDSDYNVSVPSIGNTTLDISLVGSDDEGQYPLEYNLSFVDCSFANWSSRNNSDCSLDYSIAQSSNTTSISAFTNLTYNDVGVYNLTYCVHDNVNATALPSYYDSSYTENKTTCLDTTLNLLSSLSVDVANCTGVTVMEGATFNCTINITTSGENDELDFLSLATFRSGRAYVGDASWFYADATDNASSFFYSLPISITPTKENVGNWTINFSVEDLINPDTEFGEILIFVNYTESSVTLDSISNLALYEDGNFSVNAYDNDLLIQDYDDVKEEALTLASNTSWVSVGSATTSSGNNYSTFLVSFDYDTALSFGEGNYSVLINVSDDVGNVDSEIFVVEIVNATVPVWNVSLSSPVVLNLTEDGVFSYNVSVNVSDPGETITFSYENISEEFCSLNASNFNSSGMINFTSEDCDVGFHNVSIVATNGKLDSSWTFIFNVSNVADALTINTFTGDNGTQEDLDENFNFIVEEGIVANFSLLIIDDDFLIPSGQRANYYNESLSINVTFTNSSGGNVSLFNFSFVEFTTIGQDYLAEYNATFTPGVAEVGDYTVFVNITDASGNSTNRTWFLNVTEVLEVPVLENVSNVSLTIHDYLNFSLNATDNEDDNYGIDLNYSVVRLDSSAPNLTVSGEIVEFDMNSNNSYAGEWGYNVTVNDSDGMTDSQEVWIFVYGNASLVSPAEDYVFNLTENVSSTLNFTINHSVGDNLTYEFWIDDMSCSFQNNSNCTYGNLSLSTTENSFGNGSIFGWVFTPDFDEETYWLEKNFTVSVYPNSSSLNSSQRNSVAANFSFKLNISHTNAPVVFIDYIGDETTTNLDDITYDLDDYFSDEDVDDAYYAQNLTLIGLSDSGDNSYIYANGDRLPANFSQSGWNLTFDTSYTAAEFSEIVNVTVYDLDTSDNNITLTSDVSNNFELTFTVPSTTTTPSSSSSSKIVIKFFSLRIIVPEDVIISDDNYIEVPFALENNGNIDLSGIDLASQVLYNNEFSDDVKIDLGVSYIDSLKAGERKDYSMKILADTNRAGRYKATLFANISSPQFKDWGDFFIDLRKTNESEAEELLIFTEKIISDNPECLELTEVFRRAQEALEAGNEVEAMRLATEVSEACEDAINANEQIRYKIDGFVEENLYYISFLTLMIFFIGFVSYIYKRVRFNSSGEDEYVR